MNARPLSLDDGICAISKKHSIVQINEVPLASPTEEDKDGDMHRQLGIVEVVEECAWEQARDVLLRGLGSKRPQSRGVYASKKFSKSDSTRRSSEESVDGESWRNSMRPTMRLPDLPRLSLGEPFTEDPHARRHSTITTHPASLASRLFCSTSLPVQPRPVAQSWPLHPHLNLASLNGPCGIVAPLTPPEDLDSFEWESSVEIQSSEGVRTVSDVNQGRFNRQSHSESRPRSTSRPSEIQMPDRSSLAQDAPSRSDWLGRACQHLASSLGDAGNQHQIQMVVQALPSQSKSTEVQPVFEKVVEAIQNHCTITPYITITHAVSQVMSMDEVPASPPATPNANNSGDDYFNDQTIFTHAAVVPAYHSQSNPQLTMGSRPTNIIAAPSSIHVSILERYIPPTTPQEVNDFFTLSRRSYLADRLLELSSNNGTLLLVYPTRRGGSTFTNRYVGPVIEPFLRQFILLNGLYTQLAATLGQMAAVAAMKSFKEIQEAVTAMCQALSQRAPFRGLPSRYEIVQAETAEVVLDRAVWKDWYIEQEQPRLRQNMVDYHKSGGRMPAPRGQIEVTPGMLAREVIDGVRQSRAEAGNAGLEVGVFVIRRTTATV